MSELHFHKDCKWWPECTIDLERLDGQYVIRFKCPVGTSEKGQIHDRGDLDKYQFECDHFEPCNDASKTSGENFNE